MGEELWKFRYFDPIRERYFITRYHLSEAEAYARYGTGAEKVEGSLLVTKSVGLTSDFLKRREAAWPF